MPVYEVTHSISLTASQQDAIAQAITTAHTAQFPLTPTFFVNVIFGDTSNQLEYIGGKRRHTNNITGRVRLGNRTLAEYEELIEKLEQAWEDIVIAPARAQAGAQDLAAYGLQRLMIVPVDPVGKEVGFEVPRAGEEKAWVRKHWDEFKQRAAAGDEDFVALVKAVEAKGIL